MIKQPRRIELSLLDPVLQDLISAALRIYPMEYEDVLDNINPEGKPYAKVLTPGPHKNEVYAWDFALGQWELIGADDKAVYYNELLGVPENFPPAPHNHDGVYQALGDYAAAIHDHDMDYAQKDTETTVIDHEERLALIEGGYSEGHFHSNITLLESLTQADLDRWDTVETHTHTDKADKSYVDNQLALKADLSTLSGHTDSTTIHVTQSDKNNWDAKTTITIGTTQPSSGLWFKVLG